MRTQTTLLLVFFITTLLFIGCKEEQKQANNQETQTNIPQEIESEPISEEKITQDLKMDIDKANKGDKESEDPMNLLDTQAKMYTDIFGNLGGVEELQGIENFMDLIEKADATPETKKQLTEHYELYSNSLDPEKKEKLKAQMSAMLLKAMDQ